MKLKTSIDMAEATRLTREGRLQEAMALLQGHGGLTGVHTAGVAADAPALPAGARFESRRHQGHRDGRGYRLYVPSSYCAEPLPLVVMLHGCTQSPEDFAAGTGMNALAEEQSFLVAYPAQSPSANGNKCWNWFNAEDQQRDRGEPALIAGITRDVMREFAVDPARVYVAGLSAGGAAAVIVARAYPELFIAAGVHSGLACGAASDVKSAFAAMRQGGSALPGCTAAPVPTIVFHGDQDRTVSPVNARQVLSQARGGAKLASNSHRGRAAGGRDYTITVESDAEGTPVLEHWLLHGVGHAWSGGSDAGSYTDPQGPDASREMMRFFSHHVGGAPENGFTV